MKHYLYILIVLCALVSCKDNFDIEKMNNQPKLVLYCFPSAQDTTWISVSGATPVTKKGKVKATALANLVVSYQVNGEEQKIEKDSLNNLFVVCHQKVGDKIDITASAEGYPSINASTVIPEIVAIDKVNVTSVTEYDDVQGYTYHFTQFQATFKDDASTTDYYGVRLMADEGNGRYEWAPLHTNDEPLLYHLSDLDDSFGFSEDVYQNFYAFKDTQINGKSYTLHLDLNLSECYDTPKAFKVVLYRITPEYYHFFTSISNTNNSDLQKYGLSQVTPTYSNISKGIGVCGGYALSESNWITEY
jgi:hypothetical protein